MAGTISVAPGIAAHSTGTLILMESCLILLTELTHVRLQWRLSAQSFAVLQWGLAIAIPAPGGLELVTYNFWVAPGSTGTGSDDQRFLCQASPTLCRCF